MKFVAGVRANPATISGIAGPRQGTFFRASVPISFPDDFLKLCGKKFADRSTFLCGYRSDFP
jgi:hypothetical protein